VTAGSVGGGDDDGGASGVVAGSILAGADMVGAGLIATAGAARVAGAAADLAMEATATGAPLFCTGGGATVLARFGAGGLVEVAVEGGQEVAASGLGAPACRSAKPGISEPGALPFSRALCSWIPPSWKLDGSKMMESPRGRPEVGGSRTKESSRGRPAAGGASSTPKGGKGGSSGLRPKAKNSKENPRARPLPGRASSGLVVPSSGKSRPTDSRSMENPLIRLGGSLMVTLRLSGRSGAALASVSSAGAAGFSVGFETAEAGSGQGTAGAMDGAGSGAAADKGLGNIGGG